MNPYLYDHATLSDDEVWDGYRDLGALPPLPGYVPGSNRAIDAWRHRLRASAVMQARETQRARQRRANRRMDHG